MSILYTIFADCVVALHLGYVAFVLVGQLLILLGIGLGWQWVRNLRFRVVHLLMVEVVALEGAFNIYCPLTYLEQALRAWSEGNEFAPYDWDEEATAAPQDQADAGDNRTFVGRLLDSILFLEGVPQRVLDRWYVVIGIAALAIFLAFPPHLGAWPRWGLASALLLWMGPLFLAGVVCELIVRKPAAPLSDRQIQRYSALLGGLGMTVLGASWGWQVRKKRLLDQQDADASRVD